MYRILYESKTADQRHPYGSGPLGPTLKETFPEIQRSARIFIVNKNPIAVEKKVLNVSICGTDPDFLKMFTFPFIEGDPNTALDDPDGVVITEETANKFFGDVHAVGRTLRFEWWGRWLDFRVAGVMQNVPVRSHLQFDMLLPVTFVRHSGMSLEEWDNGFLFTYVHLAPETRRESLEAKMADWYEERFPESTSRLRLEPLKRIHLYHYGGGGPIVSMRIFSIIGLLILTIASLNFINLSSARALSRAKEVGIRKVVGSSRFKLIHQFMGESFSMVMFALMIALILMYLLIPSLNRLLDSQIKVSISLSFISGLVILALLTGLAAGGYPALRLSAFKIIDSVRNAVSSGKRKTGLRRMFVTVQLFISLFLMICTAVVYQQMRYIQGKALGFQEEHVLQFELRGGLRSQGGPIKEALLQNPRIHSITATNGSFFRSFGTSGASWDGKAEGEDLYMAIHSVDFDYLKTFGLEMAEGRYFSRAYATDIQNGIIVNQTAVQAMGLEDPVGKGFICPVPYGGNKDGFIIGVVKDFHFRSFYESIQPLILIVAPGWFTDIYVKIDSKDISQTLGFIEKTIKRMAPDYPLEYRFLDEAIDSLYRSEMRMRIMVQIGTGMTLFLACMGLFGLISYSAERRTKEIGIRKVLGAAAPGIVALLSREYVLCILLANVIAWPLAFFSMERWLMKFAYRTRISLVIFLGSAFLLLIVTCFTVAVQSLKAAYRDPVDSLRYE